MDEDICNESDKGMTTVLGLDDQSGQYYMREVICADAIQWLDGIDSFTNEESVFTSLPDIIELPEIYHGYLVDDYKEWFCNTIGKIMTKLCVGSYIILLQSDTRMTNTKNEVYEWIDKSHLASLAASRNGCTLVWHKLVRIDPYSRTVWTY